MTKTEQCTVSLTLESWWANNPSFIGYNLQPRYLIESEEALLAQVNEVRRSLDIKYCGSVQVRQAVYVALCGGCYYKPFKSCCMRDRVMLVLVSVGVCVMHSTGNEVQIFSIKRQFKQSRIHNNRKKLHKENSKELIRIKYKQNKAQNSNKQYLT